VKGPKSRSGLPLLSNSTEHFDKHRLLPLIEKFAEMLNAQPVFAEMFGAI
jgi:hypothetical protein